MNRAEDAKVEERRDRENAERQRREVCRTPAVSLLVTGEAAQGREPYRRRIGRLYVASLLAGLAVAGCNLDGRPAQGKNGPEIGRGGTQEIARPEPVRVTEPRTRRVTHTLETVGTFLPYEAVTVKAEVGGRIQKIYADEGARVKAGALMLQIDEEKLLLRVRQAEAVLQQAEKGLLETKAALQQAQANLQQAEADLRRAEEDFRHAEATRVRYRDLLAQGIIGQQSHDDVATRVALAQAEVESRRAGVESARAGVENVRASVESARAEMESTRATLEIARKDLRDARVQAPFAGLISKRLVAVGDMIQTMGMGGEGRGMMTPLFDLVQIDPLKLDSSVTDKNAARVHLGQKVRVRVWSYPGREFLGRVTFLDPQMDPTTKALRFKAEFPNHEGLLRPGMFAHVFLVTEEDVSSLFVPQAALLTQGQEYALFVVEGEKARRQTVRTGLSLDGEVEILEGLKAGDRVVVGGQHRLSDGSRVKEVAS